MIRAPDPVIEPGYAGRETAHQAEAPVPRTPPWRLVKARQIRPAREAGALGRSPTAYRPSGHPMPRSRD